jgi:hypothetical protein
MATPPFRLAFDILTSPDPWVSDFLSLSALAVVGLIFLLLPKRFWQIANPRQPPMFAKVGGGTMFLFCAAISISWAVNHATQLKTFRTLARENRLAFVEGCLQGFHPMPAGGHDDERIAVAGKRFAYSDYDMSSPRFNNTSARGGPIHADSAVRIWYEGDSILRLMVSDHACPPAPDIVAAPAGSRPV